MNRVYCFAEVTDAGVHVEQWLDVTTMADASPVYLEAGTGRRATEAEFARVRAKAAEIDGPRKVYTQMCRSCGAGLQSRRCVYCLTVAA